MVISAGLLGRNYWDDVEDRQDDYGFSSIEAGVSHLRSASLAKKEAMSLRPVSRGLRPTAWLDGLRGFAALLVSNDWS